MATLEYVARWCGSEGKGATRNAEILAGLKKNVRFRISVVVDLVGPPNLLLDLQIKHMACIFYGIGSFSTSQRFFALCQPFDFCILLREISIYCRSMKNSFHNTRALRAMAAERKVGIGINKPAEQLNALAPDESLGDDTIETKATDDDGDLIVKFSPKTNNGIIRSLQVNQHTLCLSSKVFKAMLGKASPFSGDK